MDESITREGVMNLFGVEITLGKRNGNCQYVTKDACYITQNEIKRHLDECMRELKADLNHRFEDMKDFMNRR